jgi:hypothetical protein
MLTNVVTLMLRLEKIGEVRRTKKMDLSLSTNANPNMIMLMQRRFPKDPTLSELTNLDQKIRNTLAKFSVPAAAMARGVYFVSPELAGNVQDKLVEFKVQREELVSKLADRIDQMGDEAANELGDLWVPESYPTRAEIYRECGMMWAWLNFSQATEADGLNAQMVAASNTQAVQLLSTMKTQIREQLREEFIESVNHLAERLTPGADGKPKRFKEASLKNILEFIDTFQFRNFTGDDDLAALVEEAQTLLKGMSTSSLRANTYLSSSLADSLKDLTNAITDAAVESSEERIILV